MDHLYIVTVFFETSWFSWSAFTPVPNPPEPERRSILKFVALLWVLRRRGLNKLERNMYGMGTYVYILVIIAN